MKKIIFAFMLLAISSCAAHKEYKYANGDSSKGIVNLFYYYTNLERAVSNKKKTDETALNLCKKWNYSQARQIEEELKSCLSFYEGSCIRFERSITYKCE